MRGKVITTVATYCLLSLAGGVTLIMPGSIEAPMLENEPLPHVGFTDGPDHAAQPPCPPDCEIEHDCARPRDRNAANFVGALRDSGPGG